jgi:hypothetical protein
MTAIIFNITVTVFQTFEGHIGTTLYHKINVSCILISIEIFRIQKRVIRIITKSGSKTSCRQLFEQLEILPLQPQYILSTLLFVIKNKNLFAVNQNFHTINTRHNLDLHLPTCNLTIYQKGAYFSGIKLFTHLPQTLKYLSGDIKVFKPALLRFLKQHYRYLYSVDEYFQLKMD